MLNFTHSPITIECSNQQDILHFVVPNNHFPLMLFDSICYPRAVIMKYSYTYLIKYSLIIITLNHIKLPPNMHY